ncbi:hypothetical protein [Microvirga sp. G4-2]|uniref:hypothetical protein n=1 Tax=Microvirga sp. G4-2 TaxID=3434467 RepID=UPI00404399C6
MNSTAPVPEGKSLASSQLRGRRKRLSLRSHLALMCVGLALPILVFVGYILWQFASAERVRLEEYALDMAHVIAANADRELTSLHSALSVLVNSQFLQNGDVDNFNHQVTRANLSNGVNIVLRAPDGQQLVNTRATRRALAQNHPAQRSGCHRSQETCRDGLVHRERVGDTSLCHLDAGDPQRPDHLSALGQRLR